MGVNFQLGQCRVYADVDATKDFYKTLPKISENCKCGDCDYFEKNIIKKDIWLFKMLSRMGVDLTRQPNVSDDGVCSVGPTEKFEHAYMGHYLVFGRFGKTQKKTQTKTVDGRLESVDFYEPENDSYTQFKIKQDMSDQLTIEFFLECDRKQ